MKQISRIQLAEAVAALKRGGVVLLPSESSYGLCTPVRSRAGIRRILKIKQRTDAKFTVVAASFAQVQQFFPTVQRPEVAKVARRVWPGPVSLVASARFSVRVPDFPLLRQLARRVGQPLVATSANVINRPPAFSVTEAGRQLDLSALDAIVNVGRLPHRAPSAVVKVTAHGLKILRPGPKGVQTLLKSPL